MIEQGLLQYVGSDSAVKSLVPNDAAGNPQIYWILAPKGAVLPYIVMSRIATGDMYTTKGATGFRDGLFQVDSYASTFYTARAIALAVRKVLQSFQGNLPDADSTAVNAVFTEKDWDVPYEEGGKGFVFRALLQFRVWYYDASTEITDVLQGAQF
jgi:hypothetical protein